MGGQTSPSTTNSNNADLIPVGQNVVVAINGLIKVFKNVTSS
jgi:hypothetical protein